MILLCYSFMGEESLFIKIDSGIGFVWGGDLRCWSYLGRFFFLGVWDYLVFVDLIFFRLDRRVCFYLLESYY